MLDHDVRASRLALAQPRAEAPLRRGHRRRRRARPGHRLLPGQEPRHHQRRGAGDGLAGAAATWPATPPSSAPTTCGTRAPAIYEHALEAVGGPGGGARLRRSCSASAACSTSRTACSDVREGVRRVERQPAQRRRRRVAGPRRGQGGLPDRQRLARRALPGAGRHLPAARRHRQARPRRLGASPAAPTRSASTSSRTARSPAFDVDGGRVTGRPDHPRAHRGAAASRCAPAGHTSVLAAMAGLRLPMQSHPLQALVSELLEPVHPTRRHVQRRARLRQPGAQGRAGDGRRHRRLQLLRPARRVPRHRAPDGRGGGAVPDLRAARTCCAPGAASSTSRPTPRRSSACTPVEDLYVNCGWGTGGFKATPGAGWVLRAHHRARRAAPAGRAVRARALHHRRAVDEHGAAAVAH